MSQMYACDMLSTERVPVGRRVRIDLENDDVADSLEVTVCEDGVEVRFVDRSGLREMFVQPVVGNVVRVVAKEK